MATFNIGRMMLRKKIIKSQHYNHVRYYECTGVRWTNSSGYKKGNEIEHVAVVTEEDKNRFNGLFPEIVSCLSSCNDRQFRPAMDRIKPLLEYCSPYGFKPTTIFAVAACKIFSAEHSEEQLKKASILDWCAEMLYVSLLIADDISDKSVIRQGKPCWHQLENVGLSLALNDILLLNHGAYQLLKTYFQDEPYYINLVDLFHEVQLKASCCQTMDLLISGEHLNFDQFTQDNYDAISSKGHLLICYLPLVSAMHMVGKPDKEILETIERICLHMCRLIQAKDDYSDCFDLTHGSEVMGTDIEEGKCTWLVVNALKLIDEKEKKLLRTWYGKKDPKLTKLVYNKYVELQLDRLFVEYEKETFKAIATAVGKQPLTFPTAQFYYYLEIYLNIKFPN